MELKDKTQTEKVNTEKKPKMMNRQYNLVKKPKDELNESKFSEIDKMDLPKIQEAM